MIFLHLVFSLFPAPFFPLLFLGYIFLPFVAVSFEELADLNDHWYDDDYSIDTPAEVHDRDYEISDALMLLGAHGESVKDHDLVGHKAGDSFIKEIQIVLFSTLVWVSEAEVCDENHT